MVNGKKHKRGARGWTEKETGTPKRSNMATVEAMLDEHQTLSIFDPSPTEAIPGHTEESSSAPVEPSLAELREMLVDIKIDVCNLLRENENMKNNMDELKTTIRGQNVEIANAERDLAAIRKLVDEQQEEIADLYDLQDHLEQYTRKNSLEIHGITEEAYETKEEVVVKLASALDVPVNPQDIEISHKLRKKGAKPIIVKFASHKIKTKLYKARTKLKNASFSDLFPSSSAATRVAASGKIYLFENLTSYRRKIVNRANEMRNEGLILSVWTMDGKIFIKTSPEGRPTKINELEDLDYLKILNNEHLFQNLENWGQQRTVSWEEGC